MLCVILTTRDCVKLWNLDFAPVQIRFSQLRLSQRVFTCLFSYARLLIQNVETVAYFALQHATTSWVSNRAAPELVIDFLQCRSKIIKIKEGSVEECTDVILECFGV